MGTFHRKKAWTRHIYSHLESRRVTRRTAQQRHIHAEPSSQFAGARLRRARPNNVRALRGAHAQRAAPATTHLDGHGDERTHDRSDDTLIPSRVITRACARRGIRHRITNGLSTQPHTVVAANRGGDAHTVAACDGNSHMSCCFSHLSGTSRRCVSTRRPAAHAGSPHGMSFESLLRRSSLRVCRMTRWVRRRSRWPWPAREEEL